MEFYDKQVGTPCEEIRHAQIVQDLQHQLAAITTERDEAEARCKELEAEVHEWLCERCNTLYPGPPQQGFSCVLCPACLELTGPRLSVEKRQLQATLAAREERIAHLETLFSDIVDKLPGEERIEALAKAITANTVDRKTLKHLQAELIAAIQRAEQAEARCKELERVK